MELQSRLMFFRTKDQVTYLDLHCSKMTAKVAKSLNPPAFAANSRCLCSASFWYSGSTKRQIKRQFSFKSSAYIHFAFLFTMFNKICLTLEVELNQLFLESPVSSMSIVIIPCPDPLSPTPPTLFARQIISLNSSG